MPGYFEKKVMADIVSRLRGYWPQIPAELLPSDYNPDGLMIRVWANDRVGNDLTTYNGRWVCFAYMLFPEASDQGDPLRRPVKNLGLSVGAPASQAAPTFYNFVREDWDVAQERRAFLLGLIDGTITSD